MIISLLNRIQFFVAPWTTATRILCPWDFPGKNIGVGCHFLLQGIFLTQQIEPSCLASSAFAGRVFTTSTIWEALIILLCDQKSHCNVIAMMSLSVYHKYLRGKDVLAAFVGWVLKKYLLSESFTCRLKNYACLFHQALVSELSTKKRIQV